MRLSLWLLKYPWITLSWIWPVLAAPILVGEPLSLSTISANGSIHGSPNATSSVAVSSSDVFCLGLSWCDGSTPNVPSLLGHTYGDRPVLYRVPGTHTLLLIDFDPSQPIDKRAMAQTILLTKRHLQEFIERHAAGDTPLRRGEDPYESDEKYADCFFGVATWPMGSHLLTYGMVDNVLQGLWLYMFREGRFMRAVFEVRHDQFGGVGIGKMERERPG